MSLSDSEVLAQSRNCYDQWCVQWRDHASFIGKRFEQKSLNDFHQTGMGRAALCIANGSSFEASIEVIKKYKSNVDVICCDKTLGHCLDNGIIPKFCVISDANVSYETYLKPWENKLKKTILIANVCANPKWATNGNWKDLYFVCYKDSIKSEMEFSQLSGCPNIVVASTNVSNAMVVTLTQCDNVAVRNFFGYDKILLIGYDYSWYDKYYSYNHTGNGKINYMRGVYLNDNNGDFCYSSTNLIFSARWLDQYISTYKLPIINCSKKSILGARYADLETQMQYNYRPQDSLLVQKKVKMREELQKQINAINKTLENIAHDHTLQVMRSI